MPRSKFRLGTTLYLAISLLTGIALAAVDIAPSTPLVVPDTSNNRVLVYFTVIGNNQPAAVVLGQPDFTTTAPGTSSTTMSQPTEYALDASGNLYVSDSGNCRVLEFAAPLTIGEAASLVIGEPDFDTACAGVTNASTLSRTGGVTLDKNGNLWVADSGNNRILKFLKPLKNGEAAKVVVGQADFVSGSCASPPSSSTLCTPVGITFDSSAVLYVADSANHRVLGYRKPVKGGSADVEYGQPAATAFTSNSPNNGGISASTLFGPTGIGFVSTNLWVADTQNSRVLMFKRTFHVNGEAASTVLGQPDFVSSTPNQGGSTPTAATLDFPQGIVTNIGGSLWVGDTSNNRTLQFTLPVSNDANAALVLGQPDFVSNQVNQGGSASEQTQNGPFNAGPSLIALAVLAMMAGAWHLRRRLQRAS
jgi:sugar lactone lactonase YvrE